MKFNLAVSLTAALFSTSAFSADMIITGVLDGQLTGGTPKAVELYVINDVADLSTCGLGFAFNGKPLAGQQAQFNGSAKAGDFILVGSETEGFTSFFGFAPDQLVSQATVNGDDTIALYCNDQVIDTFGEVGVDGTGTAWEYKDGWAYRNSGTVEKGLQFNSSDWSYSGVAALEKNTNNDSVSKPFPLKSFVAGTDTGSYIPTDDNSGEQTGGDAGNGDNGSGDSDNGGQTGGSGSGDNNDGGSSSTPCFNCTEIDVVQDVASYNDANYYAAALSAESNNADAATLKAAINSAISVGQKKLSYGEVWTALTHTDEDPENSNNVILLYSGKSIPKHSNGSGSQSSNPDNWNREHVWAKSHGFSSQSNEAYTDINHLRPADISINSSRGNLDFDDSDAPLAEDPKNRVDSDSFEPRDAVKGDVARMLMYMDTRYEGNGDVTPDLVLVNHLTSGSEPEIGLLCRMVEWAEQDPVDSFEQKRNNAIYQYQGNRNPYIDHPEWISKVYGDLQCDSNNDSGADTGNDNTPPATEAPEALGQCGDEATLISAVQGAGAESPMVDQTLVIEGVVTAIDGNSFFMQEEASDEDGDDATSEAVYVYARSLSEMPAVDSVVRVMGKVSEYHDKTEVTLSGELQSCGADTVTAKVISLPVISATELESVEGMLVSLEGEQVISNNYSLAQYDEVTLSSKRLFAPTNQFAPGSDAAIALANSNALDRIVLDNATEQLLPAGLTASNTLRTGDKVSGVQGVIDFSYDEYHVLPTTNATLVSDNPRPDAPAISAGDISIASMNVLNLFNGDGNGAGFPTARGADTAEEYERQVVKTVAAIVASNADIIGLMEVENDGYDANSAIAELVNRVNAQLGANTYAFVNAGSDMGTDAIAVGMLYQPAKVAPLGDAQVNADDVLNRPSLAQRFNVVGSDDSLAVIVNHLRSKSCSNATDANANQNDGQGCYNAKRVEQAQAILSWLSSNEVLSAEPNLVLIGDFNSYAKEDPITTITAAGFVDLINRFQGDSGYSYQYNGELGYMDHMLVSSVLANAAVDAADWHINADEPTALDYNMESKSEQELVDLYADDQFRMSDHDPVVASFSFVHVEHDTGGSVAWVLLLLAPLAWMRRRYAA